MAPIDVERLVSVNSEDPAYPALNLIKSTNINKKWKCKMGEKQAVVIFQLKQPTFISGIDVGNLHSAFIEILVGRASDANDNFQVLLVTSCLMSLKDAKDGNNISGVRFFKAQDLCKPVADEKWDRIKIVCSQPFNKHCQYGLSFIVFHSPSSSGSDDVSLGRFTLKKEEPDTNINVGSWFAKRKEIDETPLTGAAAIRQASSPGGLALEMNKKTPTSIKNLLNGKQKVQKGKPVEKDKKILQMMEQFDEDQDDSDKDPDYERGSESSGDEDFSASFNEEETPKKKQKRAHSTDAIVTKTPTVKPSTSVTPKRPLNNSTVSSSDKPKRQKLTKPSVKSQKPFNRLMEDVVLVISGYQNPLRGNLRSKAMSMGSKYKADWDSSCTHLVCAFPNTPKFNQVRGHGKIVRKEWVEDSHDNRKRLPWRRYALDRNDQGKPESEEEVCEETAEASVSTIERGDRRRQAASESSGSDTEEEIERVKARQKKIDTPQDPYDADTDVDNDNDDDSARRQQFKMIAEMPLPPLLDIFDNLRFYISDDLDGKTTARLRRYIIAYKGILLEKLSTEVKYFITDKKETAKKVKEDFRISAVKPDWIWESNDEQRLLPSIPFEW